MIITITYYDINNGNASTDACPITLALRRQFGNKISVSRNFIRVAKKRSKNWSLIPLPLVARNFILNYNKYQSYKPFSFKLSAKNVKILRG